MATTMLELLEQSIATDGRIENCNNNMDINIIDREKHPMLVVTSMHGIDNTYLINAFKSQHNLQQVQLYPSATQHDLFLPALAFYNQQRTICHMHMQGHFTNANFIKIFKIKLIISVINIFDVVYNLAKLYNKPIATIIATKLPWCINFYASWYYLHKQGKINPEWIIDNNLTNHEVKDKYYDNTIKYFKYYQDIDFSPLGL